MAEEGIRLPRLPLELQTHCFCLSCGHLLSRAECADHWSICLVCDSDHRFFVMPEGPLASDSRTASSLHLPQLAGLPAKAIASFWLSEPTVRSKLNSQLAKVLRGIVDGRRLAYEPSYSHCPLCGEGLSEYQTTDMWHWCFRCSVGHVWWLRGGEFGTKIGDGLFTLHAEFSDETTRGIIASWLKGDPHLDTNLHESVRRVLLSSPFHVGS